MIEQLMFVACLTLYMYLYYKLSLSDGLLFKWCIIVLYV